MTIGPGGADQQIELEGPQGRWEIGEREYTESLEVFDVVVALFAVAFSFTGSSLLFAETHAGHLGEGAAPPFGFAAGWGSFGGLRRGVGHGGLGCCKAGVKSVTKR